MSENREARAQQTVERARATVDGEGFYLAPDVDVEALKERIEDAVRAGGRFVEVAALDGREVSILVSAVSRIVIAVDAMPTDADESAYDTSGFDGTYDAF